jgi:hypothetical protein
MKLKNVVVKNWWYDNCHIREYARESVKEWVFDSHFFVKEQIEVQGKKGSWFTTISNWIMLFSRLLWDCHTTRNDVAVQIDIWINKGM